KGVDHFAGALHPEIEYLDHRPLGFEPTRGAEQLLARLRTLLTVATDIVVGVDDVLSLRSNGLLVRWTQRGTARDGGGAFETTLLMLWVIGPDGLAAHNESFPSDGEAEALARFDELTASGTTGQAMERRRNAARPNAASSLAVRIDAAVAARDEQQLATLITDSYEVVDHATGVTYDRSGMLATWRGLMRVPDLTYRQEPVATLADSLVMCRLSTSAPHVARGDFDV